MRFMVHFAYAGGFPKEAEALLPAEAAWVRQLTEQGVIESFYFAADRSQGWVVTRNESKADAEQTVSASHLYRFWEVYITMLYIFK